MFCQAVDFRSSQLKQNFWRERYETVRDVSVDCVIDRFRDTGRVDSLRMEWKKGDPQEPHIFWESDITKWLEGVAYFIEHGELERVEPFIDELVDIMGDTQADDGYLNVYFTVVEPDNRFTKRVDHELYCAGHLIEAAIAYAKATGKEKLLSIAVRYVDLIDEVFRVQQSAAFATPGHQEIELALFKLFDYTGEERFKVLAEHFINERGLHDSDGTYEGYDVDHMQTHLPIRQQDTAEGHAVRLLYMFSSVADMAYLNEDKSLLERCFIIFENIVNKRMYITGAVGSTYLGESFTYDYDLPSGTAYAETCASIALALFARRMWLLDPNTRYADTAEQAMYNTVLAGLSISGDRFFYENPLMIDQKNHAFYEPRPDRLTKHLAILERKKVFDCSCCPPNVIRFIASITDFMYAHQAKDLYVHCFMDAYSEIKMQGGLVKILQSTSYPYDGQVRLTFHSDANIRLMLRIPGWCESYQVYVNGKLEERSLINGFMPIEGSFQAGDEVLLDVDMPVRLIEANPKVNDLVGRVAVMKGPLVYCVESFDHPHLNIHDIRIDPQADFKVEDLDIDGLMVKSLTCNASVRQQSKDLYTALRTREEFIKVRLIPYFSWTNRGPGDMLIWFRY